MIRRCIFKFFPVLFCPHNNAQSEGCSIEYCQLKSPLLKTFHCFYCSSILLLIGAWQCWDTSESWHLEDPGLSPLTMPGSGWWEAGHGARQCRTSHAARLVRDGDQRLGGITLKWWCKLGLTWTLLIRLVVCLIVHFFVTKRASTTHLQ